MVAIATMATMMATTEIKTATKITTAAAATDQTMEVTPQLTATMFSISRRNNPALSLAELKASFLLFSRMIAHDTLLPAKGLDPMRGKHLCIVAAVPVRVIGV